MTKTEKLHRWAEVVASVVVALAAVALLLLYYVRSAPPSPIVSRATVPCYQSPGGVAWVNDSGCTWEVKSGGTLQVDSGAAEMHAALVTFTAGLTTSALTVGGVAVPGAFNWGAASNVISGTLIAHGLGVTPTSVMLTEGWPVPAAYTQTLEVIASNPTSFTVGLEPGATTTATTVYWWAGK